MLQTKYGQETIGVFSLIMSFYLFAVTFATSGVSTACTCIVSEELAKNNEQNAKKAFRTCLLFGLILGLLASFLVIILSPLVANKFLKNSVSIIPILAISVGLPFIALSSVINGYFASIGKSYRNAISGIFEVTIKIIATVIFLKISDITSLEAVCLSLIFADVIAEVFAFLLNTFLYFLDKQKNRVISDKSFKMKKRIFKIAFPIAITSYIKSRSFFFETIFDTSKT